MTIKSDPQDKFLIVAVGIAIISTALMIYGLEGMPQ